MAVLSDMTWYDPAWIAVYVAVAAIIIATITSVVIYRKQQNRKEISYGVESAISLLSVSDEVRSKVQILYGGNPVSNVRLVILKIWNSGNQPIEAKDYESNNPIKFDFGTSSELLDIQIIEKIPVNLKVNLVKGKDNFLLEPFLLNKKESLTIKVLLSATTDEVIVDTRIIGTEQVIESRERTNVYKLMEGASKFYVRTLPFPASISTPVVEVGLEAFMGQYFSKYSRKKVYASNLKGRLSLDIKDKRI